jgi:Uma2 family endonuclease
MSATTTPPTTPRTSPAGQHFVLEDMSWEFYEQLLKELGNRSIRVTYDRGVLELMSPYYRHEGYSRHLGQMVIIIAEELGVPIQMAGSTTFRRESAERGLEPDECFYIAHVSDILGKDDLNLEVDPPPDLAIEVDITHRSVARLPIYAALGVPEVWRYDGRQLLAYHLKPSGEYGEPVTNSLAFPSIPLTGLVEFLPQSLEIDLATFSREFRLWVRQFAE